MKPDLQGRWTGACAAVRLLMGVSCAAVLAVASGACSGEDVGARGDAGVAVSDGRAADTSAADGAPGSDGAASDGTAADGAPGGDGAAGDGAAGGGDGGGDGGAGGIALAVATDPRTVVFLDGDLGYAAHPDYCQLQLHDGQTAWRVNELGAGGYRHADGSDWFVRQPLPGGKSAYTMRMLKGQPVFQGNTNRAEYLAPSSGLANLPHGVSETGDYWFAYDLTFGDDFINTGTQYGEPGSQISISGLHGINWGDWPQSAGHSMGLRTYGNQLRFRIHGPGDGPSYVYDVRSTPLSTTVVDTESAGGAHGTARHWMLADVTPGVAYRVVGRAKMSSTAAGGPRTEVWFQAGNGSLVKVIDNQEPNTFSEGYRYEILGLYTWDLTDAWWGDRNTRTMHVRSHVWLRNEPSPGRAELNHETLRRWLDR